MLLKFEQRTAGRELQAISTLRHLMSRLIRGPKLSSACTFTSCKPCCSLLRFQPRALRSRRLISPSPQALHIDRRQHLELAWQRQKGEEDFLKQQAISTGPCVLEVRSLTHLDQLVDQAGSAVILLYFYSKSCGVCKEVLQYCGQLCQETSQQKAGVLFLKHNIWNEFDDLTDVARMYKAKAVPGFIFLTGGAMVRQLRMPDTRSIYGSSVVLQRMYGYERKRLQATLRELLFRSTPSARR